MHALAWYHESELEAVAAAVETHIAELSSARRDATEALTCVALGGLAHAARAHLHNRRVQNGRECGCKQFCKARKPTVRERF